MYKTNKNLSAYFKDKGFKKSGGGGGSKGSYVFRRENKNSTFTLNFRDNESQISQIAYGIHYEPLTNLSYEILTKWMPKFGEFKDKRDRAYNFNCYEFEFIQTQSLYKSPEFQFDENLSKTQKMITYYESTIEPFFQKYNEIESLKGLFSKPEIFKGRQHSLFLCLFINYLFKTDKIQITKKYIEDYLQHKRDTIKSKYEEDMIPDLERLFDVTKKILKL